jgi:hypothetical protein
LLIEVVLFCERTLTISVDFYDLAY